MPRSSRRSSEGIVELALSLKRAGWALLLAALLLVAGVQMIYTEGAASEPVETSYEELAGQLESPPEGPLRLRGALLDYTGLRFTTHGGGARDEYFVPVKSAARVDMDRVHMFFVRSDDGPRRYWKQLESIRDPAALAAYIRRNDQGFHVEGTLDVTVRAEPPSRSFEGQLKSTADTPVNGFLVLVPYRPPESGSWLLGLLWCAFGVMGLAGAVVWLKKDATRLRPPTTRPPRGPKREIGDGLGERRLCRDRRLGEAAAKALASYASELLTPWQECSESGAIEVGPGFLHKTISAAVEVAQPGDRILIHPGVYREKVIIGKPLELIAVERHRAVLEAPEGESALESSAATALVRGLRLANEAGPWYCAFVSAGCLTVEDCHVSSAGAGIGSQGGGLILRDSVIARCVGTGVYMQNDSDGIFLRNEVVDCDGAGFSLDKGGRAFVAGNLVLNLDEGIRLRDTEGVQILENNIGRCEQSCVAVEDSKGVVLEANSIHHAGKSGVELAAKSQATLVRNEILRNGRSGILVSEGSTVSVRDNRIQQNRRSGVEASQPSSGIIEGNDLRGNRIAIRLAPGLKQAFELGSNRT